MDQVVVSVEHQGRFLHVWEDKKTNYSRFYVTPLCELINSSIRCLPDNYADDGRHAFRFGVRIWDQNTALKVKNYLQHKGIVADTSDILPLPMEMIRMSLDSRNAKKIYADYGWRSNTDTPSQILFELFTKDGDFCQQMVNDSLSNPEDFLADTKLVLEFTIIAGKQDYRNLNITGSSFGKSKFYTTLVNELEKNGQFYLTSTDTNTLAREIYHTVLAQDDSSSTYIPSSDEDKIINELLAVIEQHRVNGLKLSKDEWYSVFWDDIFTRPDIQTEYFTEVLTYDRDKDQFIYDEEKNEEFRKKIETEYAKKTGRTTQSSIGIGFTIKAIPFKFDASRSRGQEESLNETKLNETEIIRQGTISTNNLTDHMDQNHFNVKWNGQKFEQKPLNLYRINTHNLAASGQIVFRRVVTTELASTQKIEIHPEFEKYEVIPIEPLPICNELAPYLAPIYRRCCHCGEGGDPARTNHVYTLQQNYPCADEGITGHVISLKGYQTLNQDYKDIKPLISFMD
uniref:Uncharacterized protein n=1 Tax=Acrobeloides nanus TaxID=290746 RepID=A0A914E2F4_9BILA